MQVSALHLSVMRTAELPSVLLHKSGQSSVLRSRKCHSDVLSLDYEIKRLLDSPHRRNQSKASVTVYPSKLTNKVTIRPFELLRSSSQDLRDRVKVLDSLAGNCGEVRGELGREKKGLQRTGVATARNFRLCEMSVSRAIRVSSASALPLPLLEYKRKSAQKRTRSVSPPAKHTGLSSLTKEVVADYHHSAFAKAVRNGLSLQMRYIATMGTTRAIDLLESGSKRSRYGR